MSDALQVFLAILLIAAKAVCGIAWIAGIVLASGFWSTAFAMFIPLWAWYLVVERAMQALGIL